MTLLPLLPCLAAAGAPHYYLNRGCEPALLVAVWPSGTKTTFELATLSAVPPALFGAAFATGTAPVPKPGFPVIQDPDCLQLLQCCRGSDVCTTGPLTE